MKLRLLIIGIFWANMSTCQITFSDILQLEEKTYNNFIEKYGIAITEITELKKQITNAQDTIVTLRKLREEEKDGVDINDSGLEAESKKYQEIRHQCTVNWLNETEHRLKEALNENKELREKIGKNARQKVINKFNVRNYVKEVEKIYDEIVR